jgi:ABC-type dipeptide/oligopeptide/nickel transport system permease subunit
MINDGRQRINTAWWISTFPGIMLMFTVIAINLLGDGARDLLDPRLRI